MPHLPSKLNYYPLILRTLNGSERTLRNIDVYNIGEILMKDDMEGKPHIYLVKSNKQIRSLESHILGKVLEDSATNTKIKITDDNDNIPDNNLPSVSTRKPNTFYFNIISKGSYAT